MRTPTRLTSNKLQGFDYKRLLTGSIQYNITENSIEGFVKLKKDPKGEQFNGANLLYREE